MKPEKKKLRRGRGEGAIWQRADGTWCAQLSMGGSGPRRKRRTYSGKTKGDVVDQISRSRGKQLDGTLPEPSSMTVEQYIKHWMISHRTTVAACSAESYERMLSLHVTPTIGQIRLQRLKTADVEAALNTITGLRYRRQILIVVSAVLKTAKEQNLIAANPCDRIKRPRPPKTEINPFDADQASQFLRALKGHRFEAVLTLAIGTGARISEILASEPRDFSLGDGTWTIRRTLSGDGNRVVSKSPKTRAGRRTIRLDDRSIAAIREHQKIRMKNENAGRDLMFCQADGKFFDRVDVYHSFRRLCKKSGLPIIRLHDLRHTHATLLFAAGVNPKVVSERLGHSGIAITLEIYGHVLPAMESDAVAKFNRLFG